MKYRIEVWDTWGRRTAVYEEVPLLEAARTAPDRADAIRGVLPDSIESLGHGYTVRVFVADRLFCEAVVDKVEPGWGDTRKLILDQYVPFQKLVAFEAHTTPRPGDSNISMAFENRPVHEIVKAVINAALGPLHYTVEHAAYPDGAEREHAKFLARKEATAPLGIGNIATGQWVDAARIDATGAYAKDGDTIAGLVVDGDPWPDVRMLMIDCEETSLNSHAYARHPETAFWTSDEYDLSEYKLKGDAAKAALQTLIDTHGIDYIELNPHRNANGVFDDRVDAYGRYVGLVFGGGRCFNAAMVELAHADIYLYQDGKYHVPDMALKDYYSYTGVYADSIENTTETLSSYDVTAGALEVIAALAYIAGGYTFSVDTTLAVRFRKAEAADRVVYFDPTQVSLTLGSDAAGLVNALYFDGNPIAGPLEKTYTRSASIDAFGFKARSLAYVALRMEDDADKLAAGLLDDLAYPEAVGEVQFLHGDANARPGDVFAFRGEPVRRMDEAADHEWGGAFADEIVRRVREVRHRFSGKVVSTRVFLTSPLRSVDNPLSFMVRTQPPLASFFQFRLDDAVVGLDLGYHLD